MKRILLILLVFSSLAKSQDNQDIEVYTGFITSKFPNSIESNLPVRLFLIKTNQSYIALMKINLGSFASTEYATYVYEPVEYEALSEQLVLNKYQNKNFLSYPLIFLNRSDTGWTGTVQSIASEFSLTIDLKTGWTSDDSFSENSIASALSGHYRANKCFTSNNLGGETMHKGMYLFPNRGNSEEVQSLGIAEAGMKMQNYVGVLTTNSIMKNPQFYQTVGNNLRTGRYNFYNQTLEINFQNALLFCSRLRTYPEIAMEEGIKDYGIHDLWCKSRFFKNNGCHYSFSRSFAEKNIFKAFEAKLSLDQPDLIQQTSKAFSAQQICEKIAKKWHGKSKIERLGKVMSTTMEIVGSLYDESNCKLYIQTKQALERSRPIVQRFREIHIQAPTRSITMLPYEHSDMILTVSVEDLITGNFTANWFSTIFGFVGTLNMKSQDSATEETQSLGEPVWALGGFYYQEKKNPSAKFQWAIRLFNAGLDVNFLSADPSRMFSFNGYLEAYTYLPPLGSNPTKEVTYGRAIQMIPMKTLYYDYFSNRFLIHSQNQNGTLYWFGGTTKEGASSLRTGIPFSKEFEEDLEIENWILSP